MTADVRFGSLADICSANRHVRFTPNSGHVQCTSRCPLSANSGHRPAKSWFHVTLKSLKFDPRATVPCTAAPCFVVVIAVLTRARGIDLVERLDTDLFSRVWRLLFGTQVSGYAPPCMGTVEQKNLDWIERAPVSFSGSATTTASPKAVFAILADHERWPEWFPVIKKVEVLGPRREGVGTRRLTTIPGGKIWELIVAWDPGQRWAFTATAVSPGIVRALLEDCRIETAPSGTRVTYTIYPERVSVFRPLMGLMKGPMGKQLDKGMRALAARAEGH